MTGTGAPGPGSWTGTLFHDVRTAPRLRRPLAGHIVGAVALSLSITWRGRETTGEALKGLGVADPGAAVIALGVLAVTFGVLLLLSAVALGAVVMHLGVRLAGSMTGFRVSVSTYLIGTAPLWIRNDLLAVGLVLPVGLDPARLGGLALGDPFLLFAGYLTYVGLRRVHGLAAGRAAAVAAVTVLGGVLLGLLTTAAS